MNPSPASIPMEGSIGTLNHEKAGRIPPKAGHGMN